MALALHLAAKAGRCKVVTELLADNPSLIDTRDERGRTALHYASKSGHEDVLKQLLVHMPGLLSAKDNRGKTLLHVATNDNIVAHLLGKSPELVAEVDMRGRTALHFAAKRGDDYIVARLLANCPRLAHVTDEHQRTALHYAAAYGHEYVLNLLFEVEPIEKIARMIDLVDSRRWTVLHFAVHGNIGFRGGQDGGHDHIVARLLKISSLIGATDVDGRTALHLAARGGSVAIVKRLLAKQPKLIDETTCDLKTALHEAVQHGQEAMVVHLLAQNPESIEAEDWQHRNVLHYAARFGHDKIAALLLAHTPALLKQYDWRYPHALDLAVESGHDKVVALCLKKDPLMVVSKDSLRVATSSGFVDVWTQLLAHCPKLIDTEFEGRALAFVAAESGKEPLVNMLLAVKPEQVFRTDNRGNSLLHYLTRNPVFSHTLVEKVWRMNMEASRAVNGNFHTPFDRAVMAVNTPAIELLQWHLTYQEVASAYERFASLEGLRSLIDKQCESLNLVLHQDLIATIYEFLGLQRVQRTMKRKEMEPDEKPHPHPLLELLPQAKRETKEKKSETKEKEKEKGETTVSQSLDFELTVQTDIVDANAPNHTRHVHCHCLVSASAPPVYSEQK